MHLLIAAGVVVLGQAAFCLGLSAVRVDASDPTGHIGCILGMAGSLIGMGVLLYAFALDRSLIG